MLLLAAKPVAEAMGARTRERAAVFASRHGRKAQLVVVLVGDDPASVIYTTSKGKKAVELGLDHQTLKFAATARPEEVREAIQKLNRDDRVDGILIQRPLPPDFSEDDVMRWVHPLKDVDAFHPENVGLLCLNRPCLQPCTPTGVMEILKHYGISPAGKTACVIGRSSIVGKPMAQLLLHADATVIHCHSRTKNLKELARQADLLVVAAGKRGMVDASYVKPGATVIDVGIHRTSEGKVVGDVDFEAVAKVAGALTPVPGGVGPMTIAQLLANTVFAAEQRQMAVDTP
ncbi:MAG TPA: bifunctional 5,10-methylenetetrahydrofolate dehydrogenase/5,10-methenyltetrahydrofolate cyclohydrolase [Bdellovibrionota bacterium]|jgi:methylenetetrahydrofolate dehydrogenase (NADP+)/methenyltetrahydrofolate cyclohydrolase|nr:bifunctional 5,10-methylenetetrahydrofolate dehydrogenase/5,10-methenyltetrahydrofolate cyclohydrolase [Bdellovibrionota bacterium]